LSWCFADAPLFFSHGDLFPRNVWQMHFDELQIKDTLSHPDEQVKNEPAILHDLIMSERG
jgi:hypothetical protein